MLLTEYMKQNSGKPANQSLLCNLHECKSRVILPMVVVFIWIYNCVKQ